MLLEYKNLRCLSWIYVQYANLQTLMSVFDMDMIKIERKKCYCFNLYCYPFFLVGYVSNILTSLDQLLLTVSYACGYSSVDYILFFSNTSSNAEFSIFHSASICQPDQVTRPTILNRLKKILTKMLLNKGTLIWHSVIA